VRRLIINADDFGLTSGVNRAIWEGHRQGIVTSATLMAGGQAFAEAVSMAKTSPRLGVGCHVVLVDGSPQAVAETVPSLLDRDATHLRAKLGDFARAWLGGKLDSGEMEREISAQIQTLQSAGIPVSHVDTHKHTHLAPQVLRALLRAAKACGITAVRNPFEPIRWQAVAGHPALWKRWGMVKGLQGFAAQFRRQVREAGLRTTDGTVGVVATGVLDGRLFERILDSLPPGTWEFVCHPGYVDDDLERAHTRLLQAREQELAVLTSASAREALQRTGVELISYREV
jgi:hopanoid biosynthesis associated protein HpnK